MQERSIYSSVFSPLYKDHTADVSSAFSVECFSVDLSPRKTTTVVHKLTQIVKLEQSWLLHCEKDAQNLISSHVQSF